MLVFALTLSLGIAAWVAFGLGIFLLALATIPALFRDFHPLGLGLDGLMAILGAWTIVASLVFTGITVQWLTFGEGAGFVALAVLGLTLNQVLMTRRLHLAAPRSVTTPTAVPTREPVRESVSIDGQVTTGVDGIRPPIAA